MNDKNKARLRKLGLNEADFKPKKEETITISREDFDLLDIEQDVLYNIIEEDGTITIKKGVNR